MNSSFSGCLFPPLQTGGVGAPLPVSLGRLTCHVGKPDGVGKGRPTFCRSCLGNQTLNVLFWLTEHHACTLLHRKMPSTLSNRKTKTWGFPGGSVVRNLPADAGDAGLIPGWGRFPGGGNGNPLQNSCLGYPMDKGAWGATVHKESDMTERLSMHTPHVRLGQCAQKNQLEALGQIHQEIRREHRNIC